MFIPQFILGILVTLFAEIVGLITLYFYQKKRGDFDDKD